MKVGSTAIFDNAKFEGSASFVLARILDNFRAIGARFEDKEHSAHFNSMKVGDTAFFRHTDFEGTADFLLAEIGGNFEAQNARFNDKDQGAYFYGMKVGQIASFQKAVFEGLAEFDAAEIALNFEADEAQFRNQTEAVRMKCGLTASFRDAIFAGPASFQDSTFSDLLFENEKNVGTSVPRLDLSRTSIKGHLSMRNIAIQDFIAPWLHVEGPADFIDITAKRLADLSYGDFSTLDVTGSLARQRRSVPPSGGKIQIY